MRVIGKIFGSIAALAFVMTTSAIAAPMMSVDSQLIKVADKKTEVKKDEVKKVEVNAKKAEAKKAEVKKDKKAATKKISKKKIIKKKVAKKKVAKKVMTKAKKGKWKSCGVGKYRKGGKCLSAAHKK